MPAITKLAMSQTASNATEFIASNPKFLGVLFTVLLLLTQAGAAAAAGGASFAGP